MRRIVSDQLAPVIAAEYSELENAHKDHCGQVLNEWDPYWD